MTTDPWANTPPPPGHVEAANEAAKMKLAQQRKKPKKKGS